MLKLVSMSSAWLEVLKEAFIGGEGCSAVCEPACCRRTKARARCSGSTCARLMVCDEGILTAWPAVVTPDSQSLLVESNTTMGSPLATGAQLSE